MLGNLKSKFVNWLLKNVHLDEIHIGEHSVVLSIAGVKIEEALADDLTVCGTTCDGTAGENLAQFDVCYLKNDGKYWKADADAVASMPVIAMATAAIAADASGVFLLLGFVRKDAWAWTMGGFLYADEGTGGTIGGMTHTAPAGAGDQVQVVGEAITADIIYFCPSPVLAEVGSDLAKIMGLDVPAATKEFFVPCSYSGVETAQLGDFPVIEVFTTGEAAWMVFKVPADFTSITSVHVIGIVKAVNENEALPMAIELLSDYGALDEAYTTHSEQDINHLNEEGHATVNDLISWDAEGVLASLAAGDFVGIKALWEGASFMVHNETNASIIGLRFKYS